MSDTSKDPDPQDFIATEPMARTVAALLNELHRQGWHSSSDEVVTTRIVLVGTFDLVAVARAVLAEAAS